MLYLDLPACFEDSNALESGAGFWGVLDLLTRALLDDPPPGCAGDAAWEVLASLAGRDAGGPPAMALVNSERYVLPRAWLEEEPDGPGRLLWRVDGGRVYLWSERGYMVALASPSAGNVVATLSGFLRDLGMTADTLPDEPSSAKPPLDPLSSPLLASITPAARFWLAAVLPFLKRRLGRALGLDDPDAGLAEALLLRQGVVYASAMHVDVAMGLESVSLALRLAGLDRDPGWLPQAGRVVKFYFQ
jgi:hypothetical protein